VRAQWLLHLFILPLVVGRVRAEFKHIIKRRKRK